jgi:heat shock protein HslJ
VELSLDGRRLDGCGGDPALLLDGAWTVTDLAGSSPVTGSTVSMRFDRDGRLSGSTGCNSFSGKYTLTGEGISLSPLAMTRKACAPELMTQEQTVARLLKGVTRFDVDDDAGLTLLAGDVRQIVIRRAPER